MGKIEFNRVNSVKPVNRGNSLSNNFSRYLTREPRGKRKKEDDEAEEEDDEEEKTKI